MNLRKIWIKDYNLPSSFPHGICSRIASTSPKDAVRIMGQIAFIIFVNLTEKNNAKLDFEISFKMKLFQEEVYKMTFFPNRKIDFQDWQDIAEKNIAIIIQFLEGDFKTFDEIPGYEDLVKLRQTRIKELAESGKYGIDVMEWYNPAW